MVFADFGPRAPASSWYAAHMTVSMRPWLLACLGALLAACGTSHNRANVSDLPENPNAADVLVLGRPTPHVESTKESLLVAGDVPNVSEVSPRQTPIEPDLLERLRDSRRSRWSPRTRSLLVNELQNLEALFAATTANDPDRPALMRRLAEGYVELKYSAIQETQQLPGSSRSATRAMTEKLNKLANAAQKRAIQYYETLAMKHPDYCISRQAQDPSQNRGCRDEVLYYLGLEFLRIHQLQETRKYYLQLVQSFPTSPLLPLTFLTFGEFFFAEGSTDPSKWDLAQKTYEKILQFPAPPNEAYGFAHYRLAQIAAQKQDHANALVHMTKAGDFSATFTTLPTAELLNAAVRREIVPMYALAGKPRNAEHHFKMLTNEPTGSNPQLTQMLDALVRTYLRENKPGEAADICHSFSGGAAALASCEELNSSAFQAAP